MDFQKLFKESIKTVTIIEKGFSVDKKYIINDTFLVRVISLDRIARFKEVYKVQKEFNSVALSQKVIDFIIDDEYGYYITEYIPGKNGLEVIESFSTSEQYNFGVLAAKELVLFHNEFPKPEFDSKAYFDKYLHEKSEIALQDNIELLLPEIHDVIAIVKANIHHLYRLNGVQNHSDYHLFNMIFDNGEYKGVIDFERCKVSTFLVDFRNNTPHNSDISPYFASGFIDGYLELIPMDDFFLLYNIHDLLITISALSWVKQFDPENIDKSITTIRSIMAQRTRLTTCPSWYMGSHK
jgi:aminoglycoside phosphotransferase (APT) family kinase protein